jgi:DNA polymerase I-like protein with 3'-5' exonuclease and polymerase domains
MTANQQLMPKTRIQHDPRECKAALARTGSPVVVDLETTGLDRHDQIVSAGLFVDGVAHILFARSIHASIRNLPLDDFRSALLPLERSDLVVIGHNLLFDLSFLRREGIRVTGEARDTLKLLRLLDQDRGREGGGQEGHRPRIDLRAPDGPQAMNYKLKPVVAQLLNIHMNDFPGNMELAPYEIHARYLTSDLVGTWKLHEYLWPRLSDPERTYYRTLVSPLMDVLVAMSHDGVMADSHFAITEANRLDALSQRLSAKHREQFGVPLGMDEKQMVSWLFDKLKLPILKKRRAGRQWLPSLDSDTLKQLAAFTEDARARASIALIQEYRQATSLLVRLRSLPRHVDRNTGRVHSKFDDTQATGRVASTYPNLQQLAKVKTIAGEEFRSRNFLRASPGYELAVFDIGQADIRVLADAVESFPVGTEQCRRVLRKERLDRLQSHIGKYDRRHDLKNPDFAGQSQEQPRFDPLLAADLAADFADPKGDFYSLAAGRILGRVIDKNKDKAERNRFKVIILSTVNGQGPPSLAKQLNCSEQDAKNFLQQFEVAYPKTAAFKKLMNFQISYTGQTRTFMGRPRTITPHRWMVTEPRVEILVSYKGGEACWLDVVPLEPSLRVLTAYVLKAWNAKTGKLIYDHQRGRLSGRYYHLFDDRKVEYLLPIRNWGWRSIRRVRVPRLGEEAFYEGFDKAARMAFNHICQGGTADICKIMMLRSQPVCQKFDARLLIQIHDELVFEVPKERADAFIAAIRPVLEQPPVPDFKVPIIVEAKRGERFGELTTLP